MTKCEYNRNDQIYRGVDDYTSPTQIKDMEAANPSTPILLVIAWFDGEPDLWLCEGVEGCNELVRMYADEWGIDRTEFEVFESSTGLRHKLEGRWR